MPVNQKPLDIKSIKIRVVAARQLPRNPENPNSALPMDVRYNATLRDLGQVVHELGDKLDISGAARARRRRGRSPGPHRRTPKS